MDSAPASNNSYIKVFDINMLCFMWLSLVLLLPHPTVSPIFTILTIIVLLVQPSTRPCAYCLLLFLLAIFTPLYYDTDHMKHLIAGHVQVKNSGSAFIITNWMRFHRALIFREIKAHMGAASHKANVVTKIQAVVRFLLYPRHHLQVPLYSL